MTLVRARLLSLDADEVDQLATELAFVARRGDVITLSGDLGAGKTHLARAFLRALAGDARLDVPSPTFTLVQTYETSRVAVSHFDLYRLRSPTETAELGIEEALSDGVALIEWPDRAGDRLPENRLDVQLADQASQHSSSADVRDVALTAHGSWAPRLDRLLALRRVIRNVAPHSHLAYIQGDASVRRYGRLRDARGTSHIVMDWPPQPDGPAIRDGLPYSRIAHLAEHVVPFAAIADALRLAGLRTPRVRSSDLDQGLLVIEDFGDLTFGAALALAVAAGGHSAKTARQSELWRAATDVLLHLRGKAVPSSLVVDDVTPHVLQPFDTGALHVEAALLLDWYWPLVHAEDAPPAARTEFESAWAPLFARIHASEQGWMLRDYHSPNLMWLETAAGTDRVGLLDFQDALHGPLAYDLVSLLQDARVDVPAHLEAELLNEYCAGAAKTLRPLATGSFDAASFRVAYAALGAQRATKILGIFSRLHLRDGKSAYLAHLPRIWTYLDRNLANAELTDLRRWYERHFPPDVRSGELPPRRMPPTR